MSISGHSNLISFQDDVSWIAACVGWPFLTTHFLLKSDAALLFTMFHPAMAILMIVAFIQTRLNFKDFKVICGYILKSDSKRKIIIFCIEILMRANYLILGIRSFYPTSKGSCNIVTLNNIRQLD